MQLDQREVMDAAFNNDIRSTSTTLDILKLFKGKPCPTFTSTHKEMTSLILSSVSTSAYRGTLDKEFAIEIIDRTATMVELYPFIHLVVMAADIHAKNPEVIPTTVRKALTYNQYTPLIKHAIEEMSVDALKCLLMCYDTGMIKRSKYLFTPPIIRRIYEDGIIPDYLVFAFMASNLRMAIDEVFNRYIEGIIEEYDEDDYEEG